MNIGFIGLGNMGAAIAASLLRAGHALTVWNRTRAKAAPLAAAGARIAETPGAAAAGCDVVMTMLADDHAVDSTVFGSGGLRDALPAGAIHVCLSTISVALARRLAAAHADAGQHYLSAPVYRTYGELIVKAAYHPPGIKLPLGLKDIRLVLAAAEDAAVPLPIASLIRDHFLTLLAREGEDLDWSALGLLAADNAGLPR